MEETLLQDAYRDGQGVQDTAPQGKAQSFAQGERSAAGGSASTEKLSWAQQKEEQARQRKAANDMRKCEEKIASAEEQIASLEEKMAMPENYSDAVKFGELARQKEQLEEELSSLYEQWEELSESAE